MKLLIKLYLIFFIPVTIQANFFNVRKTNITLKEFLKNSSPAVVSLLGCYLTFKAAQKEYTSHSYDNFLKRTWTSDY